MRAFRAALALGIAVVVGLGAGRVLSLGLLAAALLVPMLVLQYLYAVHVYEGEPVRVVAFTVGWGIMLGIGFGILERILTPEVASLQLVSTSHRVLVDGLFLPPLAVAAMAAGPLLLLPYKRFNDVLDGATFGVAAAAAFASTVVIVDSLPLLAEGLRPSGDPTAWIYRLMIDALAAPLVAAGAVGGATGAAWLRYRAPAGDRGKLGPLGHPVVAFPCAAALVAVIPIAELELRSALALLASLAAIAVGLLWLRQVIHVGLVEEAAEQRLGAAITCANCRRRTASGGFCTQCGVALKALPKARPERSR